jgi:chromosome partitioning protein
MATKISFSIQKGGTAKTTSALHTAHVLGHEMGKRTLLVDLDPQGNLSWTAGKVSVYDQPRTICDLFRDDELTFADCIVGTQSNNVDLISSHLDFLHLVESMWGSPKGLLGLREKLDPVTENKYDYIIIDTPPSLSGPCISNALAISDYYIMPLEAESAYALKGVEQFVRSARTFKKTVNPELTFLGVLITRCDLRTQASQGMVEAIRQYFGDKVFSTMINRNTTIAKAAMAGKNVFQLDARMSGAHNYRAFTEEMISWIERDRASLADRNTAAEAERSAQALPQ